VVALTLSGFKQESDVDDDYITSQYTWNDSSLWILRTMGCPIVLLCACLSYYILRNYPISKDIANQINDAVKCKAEAKNGTYTYTYSTVNFTVRTDMALYYIFLFVR
jgi:Na+/melibiose symporter-like transporter